MTNQPPQFDPMTGATIDPGGPQTNFVSLATIQKRQVAHLQNFAVIVARLEALTAKELAGESLDTDDKSFINRLMEEGQPAAFPQSSSSVSIGLQGFSSEPVPSANSRPRKGRLGLCRAASWCSPAGTQVSFTERSTGKTTSTSTATTARRRWTPSSPMCTQTFPILAITPPDPGSILHEAVGRVNLLMLAVDNGTDRFICAGPVLSHYEFEVIGDPRRISDEEWGGDLVLVLEFSKEIFHPTYPRAASRAWRLPSGPKAILCRCPDPKSPS